MDARELNIYIAENAIDAVPKILEGLQCDNIKIKDNYITASNPDGDNTSAITCYINEDSVVVINWTRGFRGGIISFTKNIKGCEFFPAYKWICQMLGLPYAGYKKAVNAVPKDNPFIRLKRYRYVVKPVKPVESINEIIMNRFVDLEWEGLFREGVTPKTCKEFGVKYSYEQKRIIYPHRYAVNGELVAYNARTVIDNYEELGIPKFLISKDI